MSIFTTIVPIMKCQKVEQAIDFFFLLCRKKLEYHGKEAPDNYIDIYCFNWRRSIGKDSYHNSYIQ